jgi:hypothetical protein
VGQPKDFRYALRVEQVLGGDHRSHIRSLDP